MPTRALRRLSSLLSRSNAVVRVDLAAMFDGEIVERQHLTLSLLHQLHDRREARREHIAHVPQLRGGTRPVRLLEDRAYSWPAVKCHLNFRPPARPRAGGPRKIRSPLGRTYLGEAGQRGQSW